MRGLVALLRREFRDARWHLAAALALGVAVPFAIHAWALVSASDEASVLVGARAVVPVLFALFAASTASDLVARDVATRRIDALAVLPVPVSRVWAAKALFLLAASLLFLAWLLAAERAAVAAFASSTALARLPADLTAAVPSLLGGLALGAASLFFSTLLERGMAAALAAVVTLVAVVWTVQCAEIPAAPATAMNVDFLVAPLLIAAAFVLASCAAFVRGPIHAATKLRLAAVALGVLVAIGIPVGAAVALGVERATHLAPGDGDAARRRAFTSPDGKWVAVEDSVAGGASRTWIVGIDDGCCRLVADGHTCFADHGAWLPGSSLHLRRSTLSLIESPSRLRTLEIEPTHLGIAEERSLGLEPTPPVGFRANPALADGRRVVVAKDGVVSLVGADGAPVRRLFPPAKEN